MFYWIKTDTGIERFKHGMVVGGLVRPKGWPESLTSEERARYGILLEVSETPLPLGTDEKYGPEERTEAGGELRITRPVVQMAAEETAARTAAKAEAEFRAAIASIKSGYTDDERETWDQQKSEAQALVLDESAATPMIDGMAEERGVARRDIAERILAKADVYDRAAGRALGRMQRIKDDLGGQS